MARDRGAAAGWLRHTTQPLRFRCCAQRRRLAGAFSHAIRDQRRSHATTRPWAETLGRICNQRSCLTRTWQFSVARKSTASMKPSGF